ncbi:[citrate (pro-3S)-lyase] ligase [Cetobacterium sp. 8H]|uniref:[citrate (pro-3S)-lyase] ligase n=1 Tax=Cetobacterium sp. 8H TaxID=2759681 RepID=UPI00163BF884|nr:[citrate (pro-3S)-lyase] ligase [Cetobacterium sp. 8H]MBC2850731.1 [citrate (pro-3S)-lyase] ligase [Cetobacterium sp. 8H]
MNIETLNLNSNYQKNELKTFLKKFELNFDETIDYSLVIRKDEEIVATASKSKNIIKCFAIDDSMRGEGVTNTLVTTLLNKSFDQGIFHSFVFTKPSNESIFKGVGFKSISKTDKVALLEIGLNSIDKTIENMKNNLKWSLDSNNGLLIMNCNPFTLGHQYLIEKASEKMDNILVLVVEEDRSSFPFVDRIELVKKGTIHLKNVTVLPSSEYVISSATFPNYFLRKEDDSLTEFMKLDTKITAEHFCKKLNISTRFVGEEPYCEVTNKYNETMIETFKEFGLNVEIIPRKESDNIAISASYVRQLLKEDNWNEISKIVPATTLEFLQSTKGKEITDRIKHSSSVH